MGSVKWMTRVTAAVVPVEVAAAAVGPAPLLTWKLKGESLKKNRMVGVEQHH